MTTPVPFMVQLQVQKLLQSVCYINQTSATAIHPCRSRLLFRKPGTKVWDGFGTGDAAAMTAVHAFKFADPEVSTMQYVPVMLLSGILSIKDFCCDMQRREGPAKFNEDAKEGKIVVRFNWVREVGRKKISRGRAGLPATGQAPKLPEGCACCHTVHNAEQGIWD